jgi:hypothetical protein
VDNYCHATLVPIESVSKMLGHTKITTTQIYAKVIEQKLGDDMKILKDKLSLKTDSKQQLRIPISANSLKSRMVNNGGFPETSKSNK